MSDIFISYSHKDKEYAHRLEESLKQRGFEVWLDDRIDYGTEWPKKIQEKLDGCKALILIMTARSYDSGWVQNELTRAKRKQKKIFPLLLEGDEPWLSVEATQYVDVKGGNLPPEAFYNTLAKVVPRKGVGTSEQVEVIPTSEPISIETEKAGSMIRMVKVLAAIFIVTLITIISIGIFRRDHQSKTYNLTANTLNGSVTKSPDQATYNHGDTVTLQAVANKGYSFTN